MRSVVWRAGRGRRRCRQPAGGGRAAAPLYEEVRNPPHGCAVLPLSAGCAFSGLEGRFLSASTPPPGELSRFEELFRFNVKSNSMDWYILGNIRT